MRMGTWLGEGIGQPFFHMDLIEGWRDSQLFMSKNQMRMMGCGMVDPAVLEGLGLDPERYSGFAAGLGVERFCMVRHGIDDIRRLYTSDLRFLEQF